MFGHFLVVCLLHIRVKIVFPIRKALFKQSDAFIHIQLAGIVNLIKHSHRMKTCQIKNREKFLPQETVRYKGQSRSTANNLFEQPFFIRITHLGIIIKSL